MPLITLTTDFGTRDGYVGAMKGVILTRCPTATIADIAHDLPRGDVCWAALVLRGAALYFPAGTTHVAVIDPGVGTARAALAAEIGESVYLAPDNGLLTLLVRDYGLRRCVRLSEARHWRPTVSRTFHGRDVFAPCAAALAAGVELRELGPAAAPTVELDWPVPRREPDGRIVAEIVAADRFGNLITNVPASWLSDLPTFELRCGPLRLTRLVEAYGHAPLGEPLAIIGSHDLLELAINGGSLADTLGAEPGTGFDIVPPQPRGPTWAAEQSV